ncbi:hypothetical protein BD769DRAFT_1436845, partial [Suillus cothurnatus]
KDPRPHSTCSLQLNAAIIIERLNEKFALQALYRPASFITEDIWRACPATTNSNEQADCNVNRDGVNLTFLAGMMRGRVFDDRVAQSIDLHVTLGIGTRA